MNTKTPRKLLAAAAFIGSIALLTAGCSSVSSSESSGGTHFSRTTLYNSVSDMAADSALVVVGHVVSQSTAFDIDDVVEFTLSEFQVDEVVSGDTAFAGSTVTVRQSGALDSEEVPPIELLQSEQTYLLYLTESGLEGELAAHYYVTGANAGLYQQTAAARGGDATFQQVAPWEGEPLPAELTITEAAG